MHVQLTAAHWVFLAGIIVILITMAMRKNIVVPAVVATFLTALVYTGSLVTGLSSMFNASLVAANELFSIFLIIAMVTAMLRCAARDWAPTERMVAPFRKVMRNGHLRFLDARDRHLLHLAVLLAHPGRPADRRRAHAGRHPRRTAGRWRPASPIAIAGQGMALSSDYVIRVAPGLSATAASADPAIVADRPSCCR